MKYATPLLLSLPLLLLPPAALFGCANTGTAGSQTDDALIKMRVGRRLTADPDVSRFKIDVDVRAAVVTLRGEVESQAMADEAAKLARDTEGVKHVENKLMVRSGEQHEKSKSDISIMTAVATRLAADPDVPRLRIDVDVVRGVVYLSGVVQDQHAKDAAERIAAGVEGVTRVENELQVASGEAADEHSDNDNPNDEHDEH